MKASDDLGRIVEIEKDGADAVFSHMAHSMGDDEPAGFGLDGGAAITIFTDSHMAEERKIT